MKTLTNLHILALSLLDRPGKPRLTLYELMTEVNQVFSLVEAPYSPGAFYPAMRSLAKAKMITINHEGCTIEASGLSQLQAALLTAPLPGSFLGILYRALAAHFLADLKTKTAALKRIEIELIKFDQTSPKTSPLLGPTSRALKSTRQQISICLKRIVTDLSAE